MGLGRGRHRDTVLAHDLGQVSYSGTSLVRHVGYYLAITRAEACYSGAGSNQWLDVRV